MPLDEFVRIAQDAEREVSDRLIDIDDISRRRRSTIDREFAILARSKVLIQLAAMQAHGLLRPEEIARFSPELQASLAILAD